MNRRSFLSGLLASLIAPPVSVAARAAFAPGAAVAPVGVSTVDSSFITNAVMQTDMLATGFGVHFFGEPLEFSAVEVGGRS
jgi:hypothetical protein